MSRPYGSHTRPDGCSFTAPSIVCTTNSQNSQVAGASPKDLRELLGPPHESHGLQPSCWPWSALVATMQFNDIQCKQELHPT